MDFVGKGMDKPHNFDVVGLVFAGIFDIVTDFIFSFYIFFRKVHSEVLGFVNNSNLIW